MKKLSVCLTSIILGYLVFMCSSYAKVRSYTFQYTVTNHSGATLKATKIDNSSRVTSTVQFSPSDIVASRQTMKITGMMAVDGPILKYFPNPTTVTKIIFSLTEGKKETIFTVFLTPTYLRGVIIPTDGVCSGYSFVTTKTSVDIIKNPTSNVCNNKETPYWGGTGF